MLLYLCYAPGDSLVDVTKECYTLGHTPYIPGYMHAWSGKLVPYEQVVEQEKYGLARCDGMYVTESVNSHPISKALYEYAVAQKIPVFPTIPDKHVTEVRCPRQVQAFAETIGNMHRTHLRKNADYSPANILGTGDVGTRIRLWDKVARLMSLYGVNLKVKCTREPGDIDTDVESEVLALAYKIGMYKILFQLWDEMIKLLVDVGFEIEVEMIDFTGEKEAQNESIDDTFVDTSVYGVIGGQVRRGVWGT